MIEIPKQYGLIGFPLSHSFSPAYFAKKFTVKKINAKYQLFPLATIELFPQLLKENNLSGLNVTIPYKEQIIPYLDELSTEAKATGAVNCISFEHDKLIGYNTDVIGFEQSLKNLVKGRKTALILGTGGAAKAVAYVLKKLGIRHQFVSRKKEAALLTYKEAQARLADFEIIINTTPLGMFPHTNESPITDFSKVNEKHLFYDLIYNPAETHFLKQAKEQGAAIKNGQEMLELQAEASWDIWLKVNGCNLH